ncbi:hypothetical protein [Mesorhizobium sp. M0140]|uniref:hypothetical protein n=1 Tax=Mesorhizobium sp. M0140 TaxID=2956893 RepID=UPI00333AB6A7
MIVDFGFASLLDKFEEHYGKRAGKFLVGLIGAAVVSVCFSLIWQFISPLIGWATTTANGTSAVWLIWRGVSAMAAIAVLIAGGASVAAAIDAKRLVREAEAVMGDAYIIFESATAALIEAKGLVDDVNRGAKVVDISPQRTGKLVSDAQATLQQMKDTREKLSATRGRGRKRTDS